MTGRNCSNVFFFADQETGEETAKSGAGNTDKTENKGIFFPGMKIIIHFITNLCKA